MESTFKTRPVSDIDQPIISPLPMLATPYLIFLGDAQSDILAKTGNGIKHWRPELCLGQLRLDGCVADLGLPDMSVREASIMGAKSLILGAAPAGGQFEAGWMPTLYEAVECGLDIVAGFHSRLNDIPKLVDAAELQGVRLIDVRIPPDKIAIASGRKRTGLRLLTVGTDCAVGKKYTALAIESEMRSRNMPASFRATGQTGMMIAGRGVPMDSVVSDFLSGAAELISADNAPEHWDIIEGQGSLFHPAYAAVSLGLLHGSQPDAIVFCHEASRDYIDEYPNFRIPPISECIDRNLLMGTLTNPKIRCVGVSLNSSQLDPAAREAAMRKISDEIGVPCVDPLVEGVEAIVDLLEQEF
jgi:uncharacterized NAD-dependent epimerase/dehydratase family protein